MSAMMAPLFKRDSDVLRLDARALCNVKDAFLQRAKRLPSGKSPVGAGGVKELNTINDKKESHKGVKQV